jgi:hypothetical protein
MRLPTTRAALSDYLEGIRIDVDERLDTGRDGMSYNASRSLKRSLATEATEEGGSFSAMGHWKWVGNGRGPGKMPPLPPLVQWAKDIGFPGTESQTRSFAYAVARTIAMNGSSDHQAGGTNIFTDAIEEARPGMSAIATAFANDLRDPIREQFTKAFAA